ncbi:hypothetical protein SO802_006069 [Lithocarpus litseifolius]|uniref:Uncharacterized protein n=1 Tax=Lithocarpus litseifolius TaxID=425828 RepID=A0AAW2DKL2_9ROSI
MSTIRNPILTPVSPGSYSNANLTPSFHPFCRLCPHFQVGEAPTVWRHGYQRALPVPFWEMTMTPLDFHHMNVRRYDGALINLEGEWGKQLGIDLLKRRYTTQMIRYFDIKANYRPLPQVTGNDYAKMARAFLLYLLKAFLSTNRG